MALAIAVGLYRLSEDMVAWGWGSPALRYGLPGALLMLGWWVAYRIVNVPKFADFLIAVEAEMNKVSWPSRDELIRSSAVVIFVIFLVLFLISLVARAGRTRA